MSKVAEGLTPENYGDYVEIKISKDDPRPFDPQNRQILDYWESLRTVVKNCGKVAYFWKTLKNLRNGVPEVKDLALSRGHDEDYYSKAIDAWVFDSKRALQLFKLAAYEQGIRFCYEDRNFLNSLINDDRRDSYYGTIRLGKKNGVIYTPEEIEERYQARIENRLKKANSTKPLK